MTGEIDIPTTTLAQTDLRGYGSELPFVRSRDWRGDGMEFEVGQGFPGGLQCCVFDGFGGFAMLEALCTYI